MTTATTEVFQRAIRTYKASAMISISVTGEDVKFDD